jgi:chromatin remodeling complex protein RSC6
MDSPYFPAYVFPNPGITFNYTGIGGRVRVVTLFILRYLKKKLKNAIINPLTINMEDLKMAEAKGLSKPVKLKNELAAFLGATELPRTEITKKLWDYIKANKLQTKTENGKPENAGKFIVADAKLLPIFRNTRSTSKSGTVTDLTNLNEGQTINMMQMAAVVAANIE